MGNVTLVYSRGRSPLNLLTRIGSRKWDHVAIKVSDDKVIEARALEGVVESHYDDFLRRSSTVEQVDIAVPNSEEALAWARSQVGSSYDWGSIVEFVLRMLRWPWEVIRQILGKSPELQSTLKWQCAELVETALEHGGLQRFRTRLHRVTPDESYMVL